MKNHNPAMLVVMETRIGEERAKEITDMLPFDGAIHTDTIGYVGGLWVLWNLDVVEIIPLAITKQEIHVVVKVQPSNFSQLFSAIYASPRSAERHILWINLMQVADLHNMSWVIVGDFNEPLLKDDKFGGQAVNGNRALLVKDCLDKCNMIDIRFSGPRYTWNNSREVQALIHERMDRFFVNPSWCLMYLEARITHLTRCYLDHYLMLMEMWPRMSNARKKPFKFQTCWLSNPTFSKILLEAWNQTAGLVEATAKFSKDAAH